MSLLTDNHQLFAQSVVSRAFQGSNPVNADVSPIFANDLMTIREGGVKGKEDEILFVIFGDSFLNKKS